MPTLDSSDVNADDAALASQYNALRDDIEVVVTEVYTAGEDVSANVPVCKNGTADEIINLFLEGENAQYDFDTDQIQYVAGCPLDVDKVAVVYQDTGSSTLKIIAGVVLGGAITWGTAQEVDAANCTDVDICQLGTDKIALVYTDAADSKGKCRIATISGTVFTLGTETEFDGSGSNDFNSVCKLDTDKIIVLYENGTDTLAKAATISGTTPTFGSAATVASGQILDSSCCQLDTDKALMVYKDAGSESDARVATVSGTTVSFSAAEVNFRVTGIQESHSVAQLTTDKAIITYAVQTTLYSIVCSVAGSTPSFGVENSILSTDGFLQIRENTPRACTALSATQACVVYSSESKLFYSLLTISGTTVHGSNVGTVLGKSTYLTAVDLGDENRFLIAFNDVNNTNGSGFIVAINGNEEDYVGITKTAIASGNTGRVQKRGIMPGLAGLTVGAAYYGAADAIQTTKTSVFVGVARDTDEIELSNNDPSKIASEHLRHYRIQTSRAAVTTSGTEKMVLPFEPSMIQFFTFGNPGSATNAKSIGTWTPASQGSVVTTGAGVDSLDIANVIASDTDGTSSQKASASVSGRILTLTWVKASSGEDANVEIVAYR